MAIVVRRNPVIRSLALGTMAGGLVLCYELISDWVWKRAFIDDDVFSFATVIVGSILIVGVTDYVLGLRETGLRQSLERSNERYSRAVAATGDVIWEWEVSTGRVSRSQKFWERFGYDFDRCDESFHFWSKLLHPEDRDRTLEAIHRFLASAERMIVLEYRLRRADGTYAYILDRGAAERDHSDRPIRITGAILDITDRKLAEERLRLSEQQYRTIAESADEGIWVFDHKDVCVFANQKMAEMLGRPLAEVIGRSPWDFLPAEMQETTRRMEYSMRFQRRKREVRHERPDGKVIWAIVNVSPMWGDDNLFLGTMAIVTDITAQKHNELTLTIRSRLADAFGSHPGPEAYDLAANAIAELLESTFCYVAFINEDGDLVCPSLAYGKVAEQCKMVNRNPVFPRSKWAGLWGKSLVERRTIVGNADLVLPDGHIPMQRAMATPIVCGDRLIGQIVLGGRKSDYGIMEIELLQHAASGIGPVLEARLKAEREERAKAQAATALHQAQRLEAVGKLAGGIAHDFNNALLGIGLWSELLQAQLAADHPGQQKIAEIAKCTERASKLTAQLLAFARRQVLQPQRIELNSTIADSIPMLQRFVGEAVELRFTAAASPCPVMFDQAQLTQVLMNLCQNAREAMPDGGLVTITTSVIHQGHSSFVQISVTDGGAGIPEAVLPRIYEPFFTTKEKIAHTGLGLSTVLGIVEQSGGSLSVASEAGHGATFTVKLPLSAEKQPPIARTPAPGPESPSLTLLLAEDEDSLRTSMREFLQARGYTVLEAATGEEALQAAASHPGNIDLLLTDVVMPKLNGRILAERLRASRPGLRVVFMSGYNEELPSSLLRDSDFLQKPFTMAKLLATLQQACVA